MGKNINIDQYFLAVAPGSTEMYLIPNYLKDNYLQWCRCEFFDKYWVQWKQFFDVDEIIFKNR